MPRSACTSMDGEIMLFRASHFIAPCDVHGGEKGCISLLHANRSNANRSKFMNQYVGCRHTVPGWEWIWEGIKGNECIEGNHLNLFFQSPMQMHIQNVILSGPARILNEYVYSDKYYACSVFLCWSFHRLFVVAHFLVSLKEYKCS